MSRLARIAMRLYPPSFRVRYGEELAALVEDMPASRHATVDLFVGAGRAWTRPSFAGDGALRLRLQASAATTWVAWCAGFLVVPAMTKALLDPPPNGPVCVPCWRSVRLCSSSDGFAPWPEPLR
jgi:hypothetical protein